MPKKYNVVFNTDRVGGAERSIVLQCKSTDQGQYIFHIPKIGNHNHSDEVEKLLLQNGFKEFFYFSYPSELYDISRSNLNFFSFLKTPLILLKLLISPSIKTVKNIDSIFYCNGLKALFFVMVQSLLRLKFSTKIIYHLRDYPEAPLVAPILKVSNKFLKTEFICNSISVENSLKNILSENITSTTIYNLSGKVPSDNQEKAFNGIIGIASMLTPWKGIHEILTFIKLYDTELSSIGIKSLNIYGDNIYSTNQNNASYISEIEALAETINKVSINFCGLRSPKEIFDTIDILFHPSIKPEPFGRVITEAYNSNILVISSGLGGSSELVKHLETGIIFTRFDYEGLFRLKKSIIGDDKLMRRIKLNAKNFSKTLESEAVKKAVKKFCT